MSRTVHRSRVLRTGTRLLATAALLASAGVVPAAHASLPADRGIEKVSPDDKGNAEAGWVEIGNTFPAATGSRFVYNSFGVFGGAPSGSLNQYLAERTEGGWVNRALTAAGLPDINYVSVGFRGFACAACSTVIGNFKNDIDPADTNYDRTQEIYDTYTATGDGRPTWVSRGSLPNTTGARYASSSADGSAIGFSSTSVLEPEAAAYDAGAEIPYLRRGGHTITLGLRPDGTAVYPGGATIGGLVFQYGPELRNQTNAISADGTSVVVAGITNPAAQRAQLYLQRGASITRIDRAHCSATCDDSDSDESSGLMAATADHRRIIFESTRELLDGHPGGTSRVYAYTPATDHLALVADRTAYSPDETSRGPVQGWSQDLTRLYVSSRAVLTSVPNSAGQHAVDGELNLYMIDGAGPAASVSYIATGAFGLGAGPNGRYLTYIGAGSYDPARASGGLRQTYLWDARDATSVCVSCGSTVPTQSGYDYVAGAASPTAPTDDGTVLYGTPQPLDPHDDNGVMDAYLWQGGRPYLLGDGHAAPGSHAEGMSADGLDVYFTSRERLVSSDTDAFQDVYDARIGGGFPDDTPPARPRCSGEGCQGSPAAPPTSSTVATDRLAGDGNDLPAQTTAKVTARVTRASRAGIRVAFHAPGAGGVRVSGKRTVGAGRRVARAGDAAVTVRLTAAARRTLRRHHRVAVPLTISFTPLRGRASSARVDTTIKG